MNEETILCPFQVMRFQKIQNNLYKAHCLLKLISKQKYMHYASAGFDRQMIFIPGGGSKPVYTLPLLHLSARRNQQASVP